jgi:diguanylate cyclase (GGDEF)-like protein/PAS domain S-box-containing protein
MRRGTDLQTTDVERLGVNRSVDKASQDDRAVDQEQDTLRLLLEGITDYAVYMLDVNGQVASWNKGAELIEGYAAEEIVGQHHSCFFTAEDVAAGSPEEALTRATRDGRWQEEGWSVRKDGSRFWASVVITAVRDEAGALKGFAKVSHDMGRQKALEDHLRHQAFHDVLTGLSNRELFTNRIKHALSRRPRGTHFSVLFIDLDGFKQVNDTLGHAAGDEVLRSVADRLRAAVRPSDTLARMGGDEFAVLLENTTSERHALEVTKRVIASLDRPLCVRGQQLSLGTSVGIIPDAAGDAGEILANADTAMYHAKENGGTYKVFNPAMQAAVSDRQRMERELSDAVASKRLVVVYQPLVQLDTGEMVGAEALLRWDHPRLGVLPPEHFISLAEQTGDIVGIGSWVLHKALSDVGSWCASGGLGRHFGASVNFSARQFQSSGVTEDVAEAITHSGLAASNVTVEITESLLMHDSETASSTLRELKDLGVRIAIDDFGTGYSSLSYLRDFPVDTVKIDRSFISRVSTGSREAALAAAIIHLADTLRLEAIAEGIETAEQLEALRAVGCAKGQGFYFTEPMGSAEALELVEGS